MKKVKRILALLGAVFLISLYLITLFSALFEKENVMQLLMASIYATVVIPVLFWAYSLIYKLLKKKNGDDDKEDETHN